MTTPPRSDDSNPADGRASTPTLVTWCAWRGTAGPPPMLGRTAEDAEKNLFEQLAHFYTKVTEQPCEHPRARARQEIPRYKNVGLLCFCAPSEAAAFHQWVETSSLSAEEALLRWRVVFPSQTEIDPLKALARAMDRAAHGVLEGGSEGLPRLSRETQARIAVLSRFLEKLPRMSEARVEGLQVEFDAPTR